MARNTILLRGMAREEGRIVETATITPGMLVQLETGGEVIRHAVDGGQAFPMFAKENHENDGAGIDTVIADADSITILFPEQGAKINAFTTDTIAEGDFVCSDGVGGVRLADSGDYVIGQASADSDLGGSVGRVEIYVAALGVSA
jgi:hypothetical protein